MIEELKTIEFFSITSIYIFSPWTTYPLDFFMLKGLI